MVATVLQVGCTLALLWTGSFDSLVIYASVGLAIFSMLTISAVYVLRVKRPDLPRPFKTRATRSHRPSTSCSPPS